MLPIDAPERERALDTGQSFLVQAPAGSGKTELLTQRYLALLAIVEEPETIVAITFTRKAAGEMRNRITAALERARLDAPAEDHALRTWTLARAAMDHDIAQGWNLLENPRRLRVMTLDALAASIASQMPWMSRLGGAMEPSEDSAELHREAAGRTLALVEIDSPIRGAIEHLLLHLDNNAGQAAGLLTGMLARRDQWLRHILSGWDRATLEGALANIVDQALDKLDAFRPPAAWELLAYSGRDPGEADRLARYRALAMLLLTAKGEPRKSFTVREGFPPKDPRKEEMVEFVAGLNDEFVRALANVDNLPAAHYTDAQWATLEALRAVLPMAVAQLQLVFGERRVVDYVELTLRAIAALGTEEQPTPLAYALDFRLQHLLIDEFQDTSVTKLRLLERLTGDWMPGDGRTIFAVGDPMQSIYRFQEADVALFQQCRERGLGRLPLEFLQLRANFRSAAGLIDWFNTVFPRVLASADDPVTGAVRYAPSTAQRPAREGEPVQCHPAESGEEARLVADLVEAAPGQVAILVRRRADAYKIVPELHRRGIRFQAVDMDPLGDRPVIQDLLALTRALVHRGDRTAWLSVLRAPWCGLELREMERIASAGPDILAALAASSEPRAVRLMATLLPAIEDRRRTSLRRAVEQTWRSLGGPACLRDRAEEADAEQFLQALEEIDESGDLAGFSALDNALAKLSAAPDPEAPDRVQLMTMHKSKGLEFDTVILPGLGNKPRTSEPRLLRWAEPGELVAGSIGETGGLEDGVYNFLRWLDGERDSQEAGRLLYVAATRARHTLHLVGGEAASGSFLARLWHAVADAFAAPPPAPAPAEAPAKPPGVPLRRVPDGWEAPPPPPAIHWKIRPAAVGQSTEEPAFDWGGQTRRDIGTVVHAALQSVTRQGLAEWSPPRLREIRHVLTAQLSTLGVPADELREATAQAIKALERTLTSPRGRWILDAHEEAVSEWELGGVVAGAIVARKLDRSFVADGIRWIIDYKTGSHTGGNPEGFLDEEHERYRAQLETYAELVSYLDTRPIRLGLYFPMLDGWREWEWVRGATTARRRESATGPAES